MELGTPPLRIKHLTESKPRIQIGTSWIDRTAVFLLKIPEVSIEILDESEISRWSLEVLARFRDLLEIETLES